MENRFFQFVRCLFFALFVDLFPAFGIALLLKLLYQAVPIEFISYERALAILLSILLFYTVYWYASDGSSSAAKTQLAEDRRRSDRLNAEMDALRKQRDELKQKNEQLDRLILQRATDRQVTSCVRPALRTLLQRGYFSNTATFQSLMSGPILDVDQRLVAAWKEPISILPPVNIAAVVSCHDGANKYQVTLNHCSCPDFQYRHFPCKHMYRLALELGLFAQNNLQSVFSRIAQEYDDLVSAENKNKCFADALDKRQADIERRERIINDTEQSHPWLAKEFADLMEISDQSVARHLREKQHPAYTAAQQVSAIAKEKKDLQYHLKLAEYQLSYYEAIFPWLEEFKTLPPKIGAEYAVNADSGYDAVKHWLSPEEYQSLSSTEKNQLALDRYQHRNRTDWEAGIEYERFVGWAYEQKGYVVQYSGATLGLEDMGRDLIAVKDGVTLVIQCKRWTQEKTVHEKHVFQLYGSAVLLSLSSRNSVKGLFVTTTKLSDTARKCADYLHIYCLENYPMQPYPLIKCNISNDGERIYHLPFDQQYDRVIIEPQKGEFYAWTVTDAERAGFRRARRWYGD